MVFRTSIFVTANFCAGIDPGFIRVVYCTNVCKTGQSVGNVALAFKIVQDFGAGFNSCTRASRAHRKVVEQIRVGTCVDPWIKKQDDFFQVGRSCRFAEIKRVLDPFSSDGNVFVAFNGTVGTFQFQNKRRSYSRLDLDFELIVGAEV